MSYAISFDIWEVRIMSYMYCFPYVVHGFIHRWRSWLLFLKSIRRCRHLQFTETNSVYAAPQKMSFFVEIEKATHGLLNVFLSSPPQLEGEEEEKYRLFRFQRRMAAQFAV